MIREFKESAKPFKLGRIETKIRVCDICYGTKFTRLGDGRMKCKKCNQVYWV